MRTLKIIGGSVALLYVVCAVLAVLSFPASAADGVGSFAWLGAMVDSTPVWLQVATMVVTAASGIAALTPTPKDDGVFLVIRKLIDVCALNVVKARNQSLKDKAEQLIDKKYK